MAVKALADPTDKGMIRVLVYGTLKKGHSNHILLEQAKADFLGYDSITGKYNMFDMGSIPATMESESKNRIRGELYAISPDGLAALDMLEGHPNFYARRKLWTDLNARRAWVYMLKAKNYLHEGIVEVQAQLWRPSAEERAFWLKHSKAA